MPQRRLEPWGGEVKVPRWLRRLLRRPDGPGDSPQRAHEARREALHPPEPDVTVAENVDRAIFGGFGEGHPGNRDAPRGR
ncbi:MAG TPA: hypothetical protein VN213_17895 [Solirubrobacteraceae bacterium]|nr:hypothetical protein [Solirubrobacteraceae bacterium]